MKVAKLFVIGILAFPLVLTLPTQLTKIDVTLPECEITKNSLFCDFKESDRDNGYLEPVNEAIDKIYINNLRNLQLSSALCTNIALVNVGNVELKDEEELSCEQGFDLAAKDTIFDRMPVPVNKIYLENCNVSSLVAGATLTKLTVIQSFISCLNISDPLTNNTSFTFKESSIGVLQNLVIDGWPEFIMKDTNISYIPHGGLIVKHGVLSIKDSSFINTTKDSIIIYPNATLDLQNYSGNFKFSNMLIPTNKQVFSGAEESETGFFYPFIICLSLLMAIVLVCLIILSKWCYKNKGELCIQHVSKDPSDAKEIENEESRKLIEDESLTCHVKSDLCGSDVEKKKQKNTTQTSVNVTSETRQQSKSNTLLNKNRNKSFKTEVDSQVNESKGNEMSTKIKEDAVSFGKRKSIFNGNEFSKKRKNCKEKASHPDSSDRHKLKKTNDSPITSVPGTIKRTVEDAKAGDDEDKDIDQTLSPTNPPSANDMTPEPEDMITDNVVVFRCTNLTQKHKSDIAYALRTNKVKVGLKKSTYTWSQVSNEISSRNPSLSSLQVIALSIIDFGTIQNGDHLSIINKKISKMIGESNTYGARSSLSGGHERTKANSLEEGTKSEHVAQEDDKTSTSEHTGPLAKKMNGSNGSKPGRDVTIGSNSLSKNKSNVIVDQQDNKSLKNENSAMNNNEVITQIQKTETNLHYNETGSGDGQDKLNQENPHQKSPELNPPQNTNMIIKPEDTITDNVVLLTYEPLKGQSLEDIEHAFKIGVVKAVLKKKNYEWDQIFKVIVENKLKLSNVQWKEINILDFKTIKNGDSFSQICLDRTKETQNPIPDVGSTIKYSGPPATEDIGSGEADPLKGGTNDRNSLGENPSEGISSDPETDTEKNIGAESYHDGAVLSGNVHSSDSAMYQKGLSDSTMDMFDNQNVNKTTKTNVEDSLNITDDTDAEFSETGSGERQEKTNLKSAHQDSPASHPSKTTEMVPEQEDTITDNVVLFIHRPLKGLSRHDITRAIRGDEVRVALKNNKYKWDQVYQDMLSKKGNLSSLPLNRINLSDYQNIQNGEQYSLDLHHTINTTNPT